MRSETLDGFTDGTANIYIHEKFLRGEEFGPKRAITWAVEVAHLLVHEYLHEDNNGTGCVHDAEFHELYHAVTSSHAFAEVVRNLFGKYADAVKRSPKGIFARTIDKLAVIEDKVGSVERAAPRLKSNKPRNAQKHPERGIEAFYGEDDGAVPDVEIVGNFVLTSR